jgi:cytochrome c oxidase subunit IV
VTGSHHVPSVKALVSVWAALLCFTWITVVVSHVELGPWNVVVALVIALIKASMVGWIFMGVRFTTRLTKLFVVAGLVWLTIMIFITSGDYATRPWDYHPHPWAAGKDNGPGTAPD